MTGVLTNYLKSSVSIAQNLKFDDDELINIWKDNLMSVNEKKVLLSNISVSNANSSAKKFKKLLDVGLIDISKSIKLEDDVLIDLKSLEHSDRIKKIERLEQTLGYFETSYEYVHKLIVHLHSVLRSELVAVNNLLKSVSDKEIKILKELFDVELKIIDNVNNFKNTNRRETFHEVFSSLVTGEKIIKRMNDREKKLLKKMKSGMEKVYAIDPSNQKNEGIVVELVSAILDGLGDKIRDLEASGFFAGFNEAIDFEFVNKPEFVVFVREVVEKIRRRDSGKAQRKLSEEEINIFVYYFREWFNSRD